MYIRSTTTSSRYLFIATAFRIQIHAVLPFRAGRTNNTRATNAYYTFRGEHNGRLWTKEGRTKKKIKSLFHVEYTVRHVYHIVRPRARAGAGGGASGVRHARFTTIHSDLGSVVAPPRVRRPFTAVDGARVYRMTTCRNAFESGDETRARHRNDGKTLR